MAAWIEPVTLEGEHVVLEPLALDHAGALAEATTGMVTCRSRSATGKAGG